jgi:hypothetical protein
MDMKGSILWDVMLCSLLRVADVWRSITDSFSELNIFKASSNLNAELVSKFDYSLNFKNEANKSLLPWFSGNIIGSKSNHM